MVRSYALVSPPGKCASPDSAHLWASGGWKTRRERPARGPTRRERSAQPAVACRRSVPSPGRSPSTPAAATPNALPRVPLRCRVLRPQTGPATRPPGRTRSRIPPGTRRNPVLTGAPELRGGARRDTPPGSSREPRRLPRGGRPRTCPGAAGPSSLPQPARAPRLALAAPRAPALQLRALEASAELAAASRPDDATARGSDAQPRGGGGGGGGSGPRARGAGSWREDVRARGSVSVAERCASYREVILPRRRVP